LRILFVEPPKDFWFVMGQYVPPPFGILTLAAYLEEKIEDLEINVIDSQAEKLDWSSLENKIRSAKPDVVAPSSLTTCNAYSTARVAQITKKIDPSIKTVVGGQHFTALAEESLVNFPEIDYIVRGEGEETLRELVEAIKHGENTRNILGLSQRLDDTIFNSPDRSLICDLNTLPHPGYHFVKDHMRVYYFSLMAEKENTFAIVEGSRGCSHNCTYCTQSPFWKRTHRQKTPERIVEEIERIHKTYGSNFFWFTDDYFTLDDRTSRICDLIIEKDLGISWFCQARCDDVVRNKDLIPKLKKAGNAWMLLGYDSPSPETLKDYRRTGINKSIAKETVTLLRQNSIFSQGTFIIGNRSDSKESIKELREYANWLDPDLATFMVLTPYPGTEMYDQAKQNNWIEDNNWANYDMIHAIMPTEKLTKNEVQEELYQCYNEFFGSWSRRFQGISSENKYVRRTYNYLTKQALMTYLRNLL
jgi:anaerobic magnesium-protoporphyrin IX monomethyl ester cyclase